MRQASTNRGSGNRYLGEGLLLSAVSFVAAAGNFGFQFLMSWMLAANEFGVMNATLGLVGLLGVPMLAASQAIAHFVARHDAAQDEAALHRLHVGSIKLLRAWTGWLIVLGLVLVVPLALLFGFDRLSLILVAAMCVPMMMWAAAGQQWCAGLSQFRLLAGLNIGGMLARIAGGVGLALLFPVAEAGVGASIFLSAVFASVMIFQPKLDAHVPAANPWTPEFKRFLIGALAVGIGTYLFTMGDILAANRNLPPQNLDLYARAGLLGRAVIWGATPLLIVYFTRRSGTEKSSPETRNLLIAYFVLLALGAGGVWYLREWLVPLLMRGVYTAQSLRYVVDMTGEFARGMFFIGLVQAVGYAVLATRRLDLAVVYGFLAFAYMTLLITIGTNTAALFGLMTGCSAGALLIMALAGIIFWSRSSK